MEKITYFPSGIFLIRFKGIIFMKYVNPSYVIFISYDISRKF